SFPRPTKRGEGDETPLGRLRPSATGYGVEPGEGLYGKRGGPSPASLRSAPSPGFAGRGKGRTYFIACGLIGLPVPPVMISGGPQKKNSYTLSFAQSSASSFK